MARSSRARGLSRRSFLRAAGGACLALPFLESTPARGQANVPTRFVVFVTGQGNLPSRFTPPNLGGEALQLSEMLQPLSGLEQKLLVLSGVNNLLPSLHTSNGHNAAGHTLLSAERVDTTGTGQFDPNIEVAQNHWCLGPSIDHYIAAQLGAPPPLNLAVGGSGPGENRMFYQMKAPNAAGANPEAPLENDPIDAFMTNLVGLPSGPATSRADRFRGQRSSVLDGVMASFASLDKTVSAADRHRLDAHLEALSKLEQSLSYVPPVECGTITQNLPPGYENPSNQNNWANTNQQAELMNDIMVATLACGARQVVTVQDTQYHGPVFEYLPEGPVDGWHAQVHNDPALGLNLPTADDNPVLRAGFLEYARRYNDLLTKMDAIVEPNGKTLLDNSIVLWISEFGTGQTHSPNNLPIVLAGGGGRIVMNRHLDRSGATTGDLYTSLLHAFDIMDPSFGYAGPGMQNGPISGLVG